MFFQKDRNTLEAIRSLANKRGTTGGLIKRIDENRELLELLHKEAPDLMRRCGWIEGWISCNDEFFVQLQAILGTEFDKPHCPRKWPGIIERDKKNFG